MEDARFVRFVDDDGSVIYHATYTAYSGSRISQQLLTTNDFSLLHLATDGGRRRPRTRGWHCFPAGYTGASPRCRGPDRESNTVAFTDRPLGVDDHGRSPAPDR